MFKGTMTKWPVQKLTQGTTQNSYNIMTQHTFRQTIFLWLNVVERWLGIDTQYLYTPYIHQKAKESRHTYGEILMLLVTFHGSVHSDRIPKLI